MVHVNGLDLELVEQGSGIPVVFSHGGASDLRYWEPQRAVFAERYRFVAYSHRFHGRGPWPADADGSAEVDAADLVELIRSLGAGPVHLVGFSSAIALRAALREPTVLRSLTIIEPNVPWLLDGDGEGAAVLASWRPANDRVRDQAAGDPVRRAKLWFELVNNRGRGTFDAQPEAFRAMWLENFGVVRPHASPPEPLTCERLATITVPALVLGAEHGMPYSRAILDRLVACLGVEAIIVPGVTHFMSYQAPAIFNPLLLDFLAPP